MTTQLAVPVQSVQKGALSAIFLAVFLAVLDYAVANIALPTIGQDLHTSASVSIWVVNAYQLVNCMLLLPLATFAERVGAKSVCIGGLLVLVVGSVICSLANQLWVLALARGIQGAGGAAIMAVNTALVRMVCPPARLGHSLALNALITSLAVAVGPSVAGGILYLTSSWRWLFLFNLPVGLLAAFVSFVYLPRTPGTERRIDKSSVILNMLTFSLTLVGCDFLARGEWVFGGSLVLGLGVVCGLLLFLRQKGQAAPLLPLDLLARRDFSIGITACFLGYTAANFFMISMPFSLTELFGRSPVMTGMLLTPWPGSMVMVGPLVAFLANKVPAQVLSAIGLVIAGCGFLLVRLTPFDASNLDIMWRFAVAGVGFAFFVSPNNRLTLVASPHERSSSASGMISLARIMGQTCGATCVALILAHVMQFPVLLCLDCAVAVAWGGALLCSSRILYRRF